VVKLLLDAGVGINIQEYWEALQAAAYNGKEALVQLLVEKGTGNNAQNGPIGDALQLGCIKGSVAVVDRLLRAVPSPNVNYLCYGGMV
jgi:ankyrin repeat protein